MKEPIESNTDQEATKVSGHLKRGVMPTCPQCNGKKGYEIDSTPYYVTDPEERQVPEWRNCETCKGEGKISGLQLAVYKARGGPAPIKTSMWA